MCVCEFKIDILNNSFIVRFVRVNVLLRCIKWRIRMDGGNN